MSHSLVGILLKKSGKYKAVFEGIASSGEVDGPVRFIRPLCPTRWLCRLTAIECAIKHYETIIDSLLEMSAETGDTAVKANGLHDRFMKGTTLLGLHMTQKPLAVLEQLNSALQARSANVSGMLEATEITIKQLKLWRSDESFDSIFDKTEDVVESTDMEHICLPRIRNPPNRLVGNAQPCHSATPRDLFRRQYFEYVDTSFQQLTNRFDVSKGDMKRHAELEAMLITGACNADVEEKYPEIDTHKLEYQLPMFKGTTGAASMDEARTAYRGMDTTCRQMFSEVFVLLKLLLVCPASSCECERSFSCLRRLKTWLRSTQ